MEPPPAPKDRTVNGAGPPPAAFGAPPPEEFARTRTDLDRWFAGDAKAFETLWSRYRPALEVLIAGRIRASLEPALRPHLDAEAEDILQEAAITILGKLRDFDYRGSGSLLAWMSRIAENAVGDRVDYWKAGRRHPGREGSAEPSSPVPDETLGRLRGKGPGPATLTDLAEKRRRIALALASLPARQHTIAFLRFFGGAEWSEIAAEISAPSADAVRMECYGKVLPALAAALVRA